MEDIAKIYIRLNNPTEDEVNKKIKEGYKPWMVTVKREEIHRQGNLVNVCDIETMHMLKVKEKKIENL